MKNKFSTFASICAIFICTIIINTNAQSLPPGFIIQQVASANNLVSMSFAPDGRIFVAEQSGILKILNNQTQVFDNILTVDSVFSQKEKGLLGIAFDPSFTSNGYIYLYYTINVRGNTYNGTPIAGTVTDPPIRHKIARYTMSVNTIIPGSKFTVIDLDITTGFATNFNHDGGTMRFGADGKLYVATGEGDLWCNKLCMSYTVNSCNCGANWIPASWANDNNSFQGKILRINTDGTAPSDNPFYTSPTPVQYEQKYFYAKGFRNPFTMNFKPGTNDLYVNDVGSSGSSRREEINKITSTSKKHYGWQAPGGGEGFLNNNNYQDPIFAYLNGVSTSTGCGIVGGTFYQTTLGSNMNWPTKYHNKYFYMDFCNGYINTLDFQNGNILKNFANNLTTNFNNANSGYGILNLEHSQDGNMYFILRSLTVGQSGLYKISYLPTNSVSGINILSSSNLISIVGGTLQMTYSTNPLNATNQDINWSVYPNSLANINQNGVLTALNNGYVTITGISDENNTIIGTKVILISNQIPVTGVSISTLGDNFTINSKKGILNLLSNVTPSNANQSVIWSVVSSVPDSATAIISSDGVLSATGSNGLVTIKATSSVNQTIFKTIVVTISGQSETLTGISISNSQSQKSFSEKHLIVYPNPNSGVFTVELDLVKGKDVTIYVMDQLGNDIYKQDIKNFSGKTQVNLSSIAKGMYRVSVSQGLGSFHQLILVE